MADVYPTGGGGSNAYSSDCTATAADILAGYTAIFKDTDDEPATGTLPLTSVDKNYGGNLAINSTLDY